MANFKKLLITLIIILIIEIILIYSRYKINPTKNTFNINNEKSNHIVLYYAS